MTKRTILFAITLLLVVGLHSQSLEGTWYNETLRQSNKVDAYFTITKDSVIVLLKGIISVPDVGTCELSTIIPYLYVRNDSLLELKCNESKARAYIDNIVFIEEIAKQIEIVPEIKDMTLQVLNKRFEEFKINLIESMDTISYLEIKSLTEKELLVVDALDGELYFIRCDDQ